MSSIEATLKNKSLTRPKVRRVHFCDQNSTRFQGQPAYYYGTDPTIRKPGIVRRHMTVYQCIPEYRILHLFEWFFIGQ